MNSVLPDQQSLRVAHGVRQRFSIDEPIDVWFVSFQCSAELSRLCRSLSKPTRGGATLTLVVCLPGDQRALNLGPLLDQAAAADRIVLTSAKGSTAAQWPITFGDLRAEAAQRHMKSVRIETAADRAVIGAMQALQAGDSFVVLVSEEIEAQRVTGWLTRGARWRGSLEAQDEDVFHHLAE